MGIFDKILGWITPLGNAIDELHTSTEEKLKLKVALEAARTSLMEVVLEHEKSIADAKAKVIIAEATSESWITRSWRPIIMLTFAVLIVLIAFGWMDTEALAQVPDKLWTLMTLGIGGYIASRGGEKIVGDVTKMLKEREEA